MPLLLVLAATALFGFHKAAAEEHPNGRWRVVWSDEFEYVGLPDPAKWGYDVGGHGWGNKELQFYTERRKENARVENGRLIIEARRDAAENHRYTSARLVSKGKGDWTYGRFEVRAKLPSGRGTWPAIWMLPSLKSYGESDWPDNGEIDVMEHVGFDPDVIHASAHTRAYYHSISTYESLLSFHWDTENRQDTVTHGTQVIQHIRCRVGTSRDTLVRKRKTLLHISE